MFFGDPLGSPCLGIQQLWAPDLQSEFIGLSQPACPESSPHHLEEHPHFSPGVWDSLLMPGRGFYTGPLHSSPGLVLTAGGSISAQPSFPCFNGWC